MKKYYKVSFQHSENVYCSNIAHAETAADVEAFYSKYAWYSVKEAAAYEVEEATRKGMPIIEVEPAEAEEVTEEVTEEAAEEIASKEQIKKQIEEFEELAAVEKWKLERFQGWKKDPNRPENEIEWIKNEIRACKRNRLKYSMKAADLKWLLTHSV